MKIAISSAHGSKLRGAKGVLDEVDESRKVVERIAELLRGAGVGVHVFHDNHSTSVSANIGAITGFHNDRQRDRDVSIHFNASKTTDRPVGTECLYVTQQQLAAQVAAACAAAGGFINRGAKKRTDLGFLNRTAKAAILLEVCFVDSSADAALYRKNFEPICRAIAESISGVRIPRELPDFIEVAELEIQEEVEMATKWAADATEALQALIDSGPTIIKDIPELKGLTPFLPMFGAALQGVITLVNAGASTASATQAVASTVTVGLPNDPLLTGTEGLHASMPADPAHVAAVAAVPHAVNAASSEDAAHAASTALAHLDN